MVVSACDRHVLRAEVPCSLGPHCSQSLGIPKRPSHALLARLAGQCQYLQQTHPIASKRLLLHGHGFRGSWPVIPPACWLSLPLPGLPLQWSRFTLMGHSMGGTVAGMFSCIFPEMVDKLILLESGGFFPAPQDHDAWLESKQKVVESLLSLEQNEHQPHKTRSPQAALKRLLEANPHLTEESGKILLQRGATETPGGLVYNRDMRILKHNREFITLEQCVSFLKKIQARVLMIRAKDGLFSHEDPDKSKNFVKPLQDAFKSNLRESFQLVEVPGNHFVHLNEPEEVAGIISVFLEKDKDSKARL
ncbi:serine hydrolase-like protein 2 isoform X3 [Alligator sinensis]|uniref:Serine hydrolase-like protein 2 isoform X3 n=1 Tax=Alligator sinensis TaxID=38654 RepID=A0A3Q0FPX6_ALLSI|nr:serine hydrolase-like protein 2 isoform X3 [Alligator sinensis]